MKLILVSLASALTFVGCNVTSGSDVKAGKGESVSLKRSFNDNVKLTRGGDLYCNPTGAQRFGRKIAYNIKWFELDAYDLAGKRKPRSGS